jgi:hypothetical protein
VEHLRDNGSGVQAKLHLHHAGDPANGDERLKQGDVYFRHLPCVYTKQAGPGTNRSKGFIAQGKQEFCSDFSV